MQNAEKEAQIAEAKRLIKEQKYEEAVNEVKQHLAEPPSLENVRLWVERDLNAAQYSIGAILRHPKLLDIIAEEMHAHAQKSPAQIMAEQAERMKPKAQA